MRRCGFLGLAGVLQVLAGCAVAPPAACPLPGQVRAVSLKMYFGRDVRGGGFVDDAAWAGFAARVLTPAFPDGFTEYVAVGQWRNPGDGVIVREKSFVVEIVGAVAPAKVDAVVQAYRRDFRQVAVGQVTGEVCAAF